MDPDLSFVARRHGKDRWRHAIINMHHFHVISSCKKLHGAVRPSFLSVDFDLLLDHHVPEFYFQQIVTATARYYD